MSLEPGGLPGEKFLGRSEQGLAGLSTPYLAPLSEDDCSPVGEEDPVVIVIPMGLINNSEP